jgi:hypothetical protein
MAERRLAQQDPKAGEFWQALNKEKLRDDGSLLLSPA